MPDCVILYHTEILVVLLDGVQKDVTAPSYDAMSENCGAMDGNFGTGKFVLSFCQVKTSTFSD